MTYPFHNGSPEARARAARNYQQEPDGSWVPAEPVRPPLLVRGEIALRRWWRAPAAPGSDTEGETR